MLVLLIITGCVTVITQLFPTAGVLTITGGIFPEDYFKFFVAL